METGHHLSHFCFPDNGKNIWNSVRETGLITDVLVDGKAGNSLGNRLTNQMVARLLGLLKLRKHQGCATAWSSACLLRLLNLFKQPECAAARLHLEDCTNSPIRT